MVTLERWLEMGRMRDLHIDMINDFDDITCEEYYAQDEDWARWMDELELEWVNSELQIIADEVREAEIDEGELCFE